MICRRCKKEIPDDSLFCNLCGKKQTGSVKKKTRRANGEGTVYKRGKTYTAQARRYVDGELIPITQGGFSSETQARKFISTIDWDKVIAERTEGKRSAKKTNDMLFSQLYDIFFQKASEVKKRSGSRLEKYGYAYARYEALWNEKWTDLCTMDFQDEVDGATDQKGKEVGYYAKRDMKTVANQMGIIAITKGICKENLAQYIELPEADDAEGVPFTAEEAILIYKAYKDGNKFAGYMTVMNFTGMRPCEAHSVFTSNIDFVEMCIRGAGQKTKKRKKQEIVFEEVIGDILADVCGETKFIEGFTEEAFREEWRLTCARLGIRELTPKCARHTCGTLLGDNGANPLIMQEIFGHTDFETTKKYIHLNERKKKQAELRRATIKLLPTKLPTGSEIN